MRLQCPLTKGHIRGATGQNPLLGPDGGQAGAETPGVEPPEERDVRPGDRRSSGGRTGTLRQNGAFHALTLTVRRARDERAPGP